jgi:hypothetical protein
MTCSPRAAMFRPFLYSCLDMRFDIASWLRGACRFDGQPKCRTHSCSGACMLCTVQHPIENCNLRRDVVCVPVCACVPTHSACAGVLCAFCARGNPTAAQANAYPASSLIAGEKIALELFVASAFAPTVLA